MIWIALQQHFLVLKCPKYHTELFETRTFKNRVASQCENLRANIWICKTTKYYYAVPLHITPIDTTASKGRTPNHSLWEQGTDEAYQHIPIKVLASQTSSSLFLMLGKVITSLNDCGLHKSPVNRFKRDRISQSIITDCVSSNNKGLRPDIQELFVNLSRNSKTELKP